MYKDIGIRVGWCHMDKSMEEFIKSCFKLGEELLYKENPTKMEKIFLNNLDNVIETIDRTIENIIN